MSVERADGELIEIGDPAEEARAPESPPRVVIEYRDRGVPWMLIPPLLVVSAVAAALAYPRFAPSTIARPAPVVALGPSPVNRPMPDPSAALPEPAGSKVPPVETIEPPAATPDAAAVVSPPEAPSPAAAAAPDDAVPTFPVDPIAKPPAPAPFPRVPGLGFDPRELEPGRAPAPPVDSDLAPAAGPQARPDDPAPGPRPEMAAEDRGQPEQVNPDLLPPDPRQAVARRAQRVVEARRKAEDDRAQFHADLKAVCRRSGLKAGPQIVALCQKYGVDVDPAIKARATRILNVTAAGVDRPVRINILRSMGYPESVILFDIFNDQRARTDNQAARGGRSDDEVLYGSAVLLLAHPPSRPPPASRPVSAGRPTPAPGR